MAGQIQYKVVRECDIETAEQWLKVFQKDEPTAYFVLAPKRPRGRRGIKVMRGPAAEY